MLATGLVEAAVLSDPSTEMLAIARTLAPDAAVVGSLDAMLAQGLDGIVIATPSGLHAEQSIRALESGIAVFCQKPLGHNADEAARVVAAARTADRLLSVDFSYRFTTGMNRIAELVRTGALGNIYAVDLTFHNAYGPDKPWFYDRAQSGGGCVMDLGVHLVDLALWVLGYPDVTTDISAALFAQGAPLIMLDRTEDYAVASFTLETRHGTWMAQCTILPKPPSKKRRTIMPPQFVFGDAAQGRFANLLPVKDDQVAGSSLH